jgi:hypothetical protein
MRVCKANVYESRDAAGRKIPDYVIMNNYDGRFLEWRDVETTGIEEIDENIGCDGSVVVHKRSHAEKIINKLDE